MVFFYQSDGKIVNMYDENNTKGMEITTFCQKRVAHIIY